MPRQRRYRIRGIPQHVISRGNDRKPCFFASSDFRSYLSLLCEAAGKHRCEIHAYVLMTNHLHLLVTPRVPDGIPRLMQTVNQRYVQHINKLSGRTGTLWEGRYKATVVGDDNHVLNCYQYIELNPVRAGMVAEPGAYRWSSYAGHVGRRSDLIVTEHEAFLRLGRSMLARQAAYCDLCRETMPADAVELIRHSTQLAWPLGNARFRSDIEAMLKRRLACNTWGGARAGAGRKSREAK